MEVYKAISAVQEELATIGISKNSKNQQQGFMFRGIDAVYNALAPLLAKHKLCILPRCLSRECTERTTAKGGVLFYVNVHAEFDFVSALDGSKHTVAMFGEAMDSGDKATNKAMSTAYKYAAFQAFCIPTEETASDADAETHQVAPRGRQKAQAPAVTQDYIDTWVSALGECKDIGTLKATFADAWKHTNHAPAVQSEYNKLKTILEQV